MRISQFWHDRAAGQPLGCWWLLDKPEVRVKVYQGGDDLSLDEYAQLSARVRRELEQQYHQLAV